MDINQYLYAYENQYLKLLEDAGLLYEFYHAESLDELERLLYSAMAEGIIPNDKTVYDALGNFFEPYISGIKKLPASASIQSYLQGQGASQEIIEFLLDSYSEKDLADRINSFDIDRATKENIFNKIASHLGDKWAIRGAEGREATRLEDEAEALAKEEKLQQEQFTQYAPVLTQALSDVYNSPYLTQQDMGEGREYTRQFYLNNYGIDTEQQGNFPTEFYIRHMRGIDARNQRAAELEQESASRMQGQIRQPPVLHQLERRKVNIPELSTQFDTGYGEGTRLREFIGGKAQGIVSDTAEARQKYYQALGEPEPLSYEQRLTNLQGQEKYYQDLYSSYPSESGYGGEGFEWGEGGPAAVAQRQLEGIQKQLSALTPRGVTEEIGAYQKRYAGLMAQGDPTLAGLRKLRTTARAQYNMLPGVATSSRYTPALRFR